MALQTDHGWCPAPSIGTAGLPAFSNTGALTANTHKYAFIFTLPASKNIHKVHFRYGSAITSGASTRMQAYCETVSLTNGDPSGSAYGGAVNGTSAIQPVASTWDTITLGTDATGTAGDKVAVVISFQTFNASDSITFNEIQGNTGTSIVAPYTDAFTGSWSKRTNGPVVGIEFSDGTLTYIPGTFPFSAITNQAYNSGSSPNEYALSFTLNVPKRLAGMGMVFASAGDYDINLYQGTTVQTGFPYSTDKDIAGTASQRFHTLMFPTPFSCAKSTKYYLAVTPTTVTNVTLQLYTVNSASIFDQCGGGQNFFLGTRAGAAWTDVTTQRPAIYLFFDQSDDGVQTGGVKVYPGLSGGLNG